MKRNTVLFSINICLMALLCSMFAIKSKSNNTDIYKTNLVNDSTVTEFYSGFNRNNESIVYKDLIENENTSSGIVSIPRYTIKLIDSGLKGGQIVKKGTLINSTEISCNSRVFSISGDDITFENLDETLATSSCGLSGIALDEFEISYSVNFQNKVFQPIKVISSFNSIEYAFDVGLIIDNSQGFFLNGVSVNVSYDLVIHRKGMFIKQNSVFYDESNNPVVHKLYRIQGRYFYKIVPITILEEFGSYYSIEGDLNEGNHLV